MTQLEHCHNQFNDTKKILRVQRRKWKRQLDNSYEDSGSFTQAQVKICDIENKIDLLERAESLIKNIYKEVKP